MSYWTGPCFALEFISYRRMEEEDVIMDRTLSTLYSISYRRMEEEDVIKDRTLFALCFISYKRMEEKDVMVDRHSCYDFLQKNGGEGCRRGQALVLWFPTKEWRTRCHAGQDLWKVYGRGMILVGKVHLTETEDILSRHVWRWFPISVLFTRYPKDAY